MSSPCKGSSYNYNYVYRTKRAVPHNAGLINREFLMNGGSFRIKTTTKVVVCSAPKRGWYWLDPSRGTESLAPHYIHGQPLKRLFFFCLLGLTTRKRVHKFLQAHLILHIILFGLILYVFSYDFFVPSYRVNIISSAPKMSAAIFVF